MTANGGNVGLELVVGFDASIAEGGGLGKVRVLGLLVAIDDGLLL